MIFKSVQKKTFCPFPFSPCPRPPWTCSAQQERQKGEKPRKKLEKKMWYMSKIAHPWFSRTVVTRPARPAAATTAASPSARRRQRGGSIWSSRPLQNLTAFKRPKKSVQLKKNFLLKRHFLCCSMGRSERGPYRSPIPGTIRKTTSCHSPQSLSTKNFFINNPNFTKSRFQTTLE